MLAMYHASKFILYHIELILKFNYSILEFIKVYVLELAIKKVKLFNTKKLRWGHLDEPRPRTDVLTKGK